MASTSHHVTFRFALPPALAMRAPMGFWARSPRGCMVDVGAQGSVLVTSVDHSEVYARKRVLETACAFLRDVDPAVAPQRFEGTLSAPSCRTRGERYVVSIGAAVTIARTDPHRGPVVTLGPRPPEQLDLINRIAG